ncbi:MAG: T9SS type A sorting domain-containing protein [Bacteroidia bacterium]
MKKLKFLFLLFLSACWFTSSFAQNNNFSRIYKASASTCNIPYQELISIVEDNNGNYYSASEADNPVTTSCNTAATYAGITKFNSSGTQQWSYYYTAGRFRNLILDHNGCIVAIGDKHSGTSNHLLNIIQVNSSGTVTGSVTLGNAGTGNSGTSGYNIIETKDNSGNYDGYLAVGQKDNDMLIVKLDVNFGVSWTKVLDVQNNSTRDLALSVIQTSDYKYVLTGLANNSEAAVVKFDANGIIWSKTFYINSTGVSTVWGSIIQTDDDGDGIKDDGFMITGGIMEPYVKEKGFILKLEDNGTKTYFKEITTGTSGPTVFELADIKQADNLSYYISGRYGDEALLIKLNQQGTKLLRRQKYLKLNYKTWFNGLLTNKKNEVVLVGAVAATSTTAPYTDWSFYIVRTDSEGGTDCSHFDIPLDLSANLNVTIGNPAGTFTSPSLSYSTPSTSKTTHNLVETTDCALCDLDVTLTYTCGTNGDLTYTFNTTNPVSGTTYSWDFGDVASGYSNSSSNDDPFHLFYYSGSAASGTEWLVKLTAINGTCTTSKNFTIRKSSAPSIPSNTLVYDCVAQEVKFNAIDANNSSDTKYTWSPSSTSLIIGYTSLTPIFTPGNTAPQTYTLTITNNSCQSASLSVNIDHFRPDPTPSILGATCSMTGPITLDAQAGDANGTYTFYKWYKNGVAVTSNTSDSRYLNVTTSNPGSYTVNVGYNAFCTKLSPAVIVSVKPDFVMDYTCSGVGSAPTYIFNVSSNVQPGATYLWDFGDPASGPANSSTLPNPSHTYNGGTGVSYSPSLTIIQPGCTVTTVKTFGINGPPIFSIDPVTQANYDCVNGSVQLNIPAGSDDYKYEWSDGTNIVSNLRNPLVYPGNGSSKIYTVTVKNNSCLIATQSITIYGFIHNVTSPSFVGNKYLDVLDISPPIDLVPWTSIFNNSSYFNSSFIIQDCSTATTCRWNLNVQAMSNLPNVPFSGYWLVNYTWQEPNTGCAKATSFAGNIKSFTSPTLSSTGATACSGDKTATVTVSATWPSGGIGTQQAFVRLYDGDPHSGGNLLSTSSTPISATNTSFDFSVPTTATHTFYMALYVVNDKTWVPSYISSGYPVVLTINQSHTVNLTTSVTGTNSQNSQTIYRCGGTPPTITATYTPPTGSPSPYHLPSNFEASLETYNATTGTYTIVAGPYSMGTPSPSTSYTFLPTTFGKYYVRIKNTVSGCSTIEWVDLNNATPNTDITASGFSTAYLCPGGIVTITANPLFITSQLYEWYKVGDPNVLGTNINYNTSSAGSYYYKAFSTLLLGCTATSSTVEVSDPPIISVSAGTYNSTPVPATQSVVINVPTPSFYTNYTYYKNGAPITGASSTSYSATAPNIDGYYQVTGTSTSCSTALGYSNIVKLGPPCNTFTSPGYTVFGTANTTTPLSSTSITGTGGSYVFDGNIIIPAGVTVNLNGANVIMKSCAKITVQEGNGGTAGGILNISNGTTIQGCETWQGIEVKGDPNAPKSTLNSHGRLNISSTGAMVKIRDAMVAVYSFNGGDLDISKAEFKYNKTHIVIGKYMTTGGIYYDHSAEIRFCVFGELMNLTGCPSPFTPDPLTPYNANPMIYVEKTGGVDFGASSFPNTFNVAFTSLKINGIEARDIIGTSRGGNTVGLNLSHNNFDGMLKTGLHVTTSAHVNLVTNEFGTGGGAHPVTGVYFKDVNSSMIGGSTTTFNTFQNMTNGLEFYNYASTSTTTSVIHNKFEYNTYGIVAAPDVYPITETGATGSINTQTGQIKLAITCNRMFYNQYGIIGSGNLIDQGNTTADAGNNFNDPALTAPTTATSKNTKADMFWVGSSPNVNYFIMKVFGSSSTPAYIPPTFVTAGPVNINNTTYPVSPPTANSTVTLNISSANIGCSGAVRWKKDEYTSVEPIVQEEFKVYPNPSTSVFNITLPESVSANGLLLEVTDMLGRKIILRNTINSKTIVLDAAAWKPGVYILRITTSEGKYYQQPVVRQ